MACVALASLISTIQLEFLQPFPRVPLLHQPSIQSFFESICSLQAFLQESSGGGAAIKDLEIEIRDFALKAEDDIEIQLSNFVFAKGREDQEKASQQLHLALQEAAENASELLNIIDNISNNVAGDDDNEAQPPLHWLKPASESQNGKSNGSSRKLLGSHSRNSCGKIIFELWFCGILKIISIVGMVGVGKTTLAKSVYLDPEVGKRFDVRGWITMPQQYNKNQLLDLLRLLQSFSPAAEKKIEMGSCAPEEVQVQVRSHLLGKRYLIVLDNLQLDNWGDIRGCFPEDNNGSCILVTTTHFDRYVISGLKIYIHSMTLLDPNESWDLFCRTLSKGSMSRSPELEKIRGNIIEICDGLPLTIVVVAKRLSKCNDVLKKWEKIKKEIESLGILDRNTLIFHYNKLSQILKVCFLYLGVFPKRKEIQVKNLIGLWIAEGYFEPLEFEKQESQGYAYLQELIERRLVLICNQKSNGKIKTCRMHSAMHSFCVGEAQKEGIFCAVNTLQHSGLPLSDFANSSRWLSLCKHSFDYYVLFSSNKPRSIFFFDEDPKTFVPFKLLRVLAFVPSPFLQRVSMHLGDLIFLRYLFISKRFEGLGNILSKNPNLQTLIVSSDEPQIGAPTIHLPSTIWKLPRLRHLELGDMYTMDPPCTVKAKLQTLSWVSPTHCRNLTLSLVSPTHCGMEVFPNLRKLKIFYKDDLEFNRTHGSSSNPIILENFGYLKQLQRLKISVSVSCAVVYTERFMCPLQLQKLSLSGMNLSKRDLTVIGMLPELKVLKLENAFLERVWEVVEGGFRELRFLLVKDKNLLQFLADEKSFKHLERLVLRCCCYLEEIPSSFVDISTLKSIELDRCSPIAVTFATKRMAHGRIKLIIHKTEDEPPPYPLSELTIGLGDESQIGAPTTDFPCRISELPQLRHLELTDVYIADPPSMVEGKLKTLSLVVPCHCRKKVYYSFPNIKKLKLFYKQDSEPTHIDGSSSNLIILDELDFLEQLESLTISVPVGRIVTYPEFFMFPSQLKKLRLSGTNLSRIGLGEIGTMCRLEVLKLENVLLGSLWEVGGGEFYNLRFLLVQDKELKQLKVYDEEYVLPCLERLVLRYCYGLEEISFECELHSNLKSIELFWCNPSAIACAKQIFGKRPDRGDNGIELKINGDIYDERPN
ncbi:PREDICTED: putative late blight resistance protein homolog R1C-3 isoform X2 [Ipomoea nil]|uniref:putative late blight resistance protein homolog R1C-3 isoform X2 n=1 Tax=Ipomoea nil TaxID=35883 RepID=UPI000901B115|nr:PREDICTED: putative late blight resistance protein homolog R1C-3 isoform X2 [Ipomoea nil]